MGNKEEEQKGKIRSAAESSDKKIKPFGSFSPMQQERILTHMNTVGTREEMRRADESMRNGESGMMDIL